MLTINHEISPRVLTFPNIANWHLNNDTFDDHNIHKFDKTAILGPKKLNYEKITYFIL